MTQKKWLVKSAPAADTITELGEQLNVSSIVAEMLLQRGITTFDDARKFFRPNQTDVHDPLLMKNMEKAVDRIEKAIENNEHIRIYGDYDVDGTTAVTMMYDFLKVHHTRVDYYIPDRYEEGYGVSEKGIDAAQKDEVNLLITLDCGIKAVSTIAKAKKLGIDVIVCDHHMPGEELPAAIILDPKQADCNYPYKELSGCGVGFKLLTALTQRMHWEQEKLWSYLDLLAISIAADIVPVTGENRMFCQFGLDQLNASPRLGIKTMLELAQKPLPLTLTNVVFVIAPRINAAGRMGHAKEAVELLLSSDKEVVKVQAKAIHAANEERKALDENITQEALVLLEEDPSHTSKCTNVVFQQGWHKGVIGIVASRIIEQYYRPTVVLTQPKEGDLLTASVRSIKGIDVHEILEECTDVLEQFGGHYFAAGLSVKRERLEEFKTRFEDAVRKKLQDETLIPEQLLERELAFDEIFTSGESLFTVPRIKRILSQFEPHGPGNMKPVFVSRNVFTQEAKLLKNKHLKAKWFQHGKQMLIDGILFNRPDALEMATSNEPLDIVYTLETNEWRGRSSLQLNIKDLRYATVATLKSENQL